MQLYYAVNSDEFATSMDTTNQVGLVTDSGKVLKLSFDPAVNGPLYDACSGGCILYVAVRARQPMRSFVTATLIYKDQQLLQDSIMTMKILNPSANARANCWPYLISNSLYDVNFHIRVLQGDAISWSVFLFDNDAGVQTQIVKTDLALSQHITVTSNDIYRYGPPPANNLAYLCASQVLAVTNVQVTAIGQDTYQRQTLKEDVLSTIILDSTPQYDYMYFVYSNKLLPLEAQTLTLTVRVQSTLVQQSVPRLLYKVCAYAQPDDCMISQQEAVSPLSLTLIPGVFFDQTKTRIANINHQPSACPYTSGCTYIFSLHNPDNFGPSRVTLLLQTSTITQAQGTLNINQKYLGRVEQGSYQYFQVYVSPYQMATMNISQLNIQVEAFNGMVSLFASNVTQYPQAQGLNVLSAYSLAPQFTLSLNVSSLDLWTTPVYLSVYGTSLAFYQLLVEPVTNNLVTPTPTPTAPQPLPSPILTQSQMLYFTLNSSKPLYTFYYTFPQTNPPVVDAIFVPLITKQTGNSSLQWNVTHYPNGLQANCTSHLRFNNSEPQVVGADQVGPINATSVIRVDMQMVWPRNESNDTIVMGVQVIQTTVNKDATREEWDIEADLLFDRVYTSYASSEVVVYERLMLDSNGTYTFTITNLLGAPEMMTKAGPMVRLININDDLSFDYARISMDVGSIQSIALDPASRKSANKDCVNGSFALLGGNQKCTIYVGVQCDGLCAFNLSVTKVQSKSTLNMTEPQFIQAGDIWTDVVQRIKGKYYFLPYKRNSTIQNVTFALNKLNNDSYLVAKVITNGYLPYQNWSYPSATSYDYISESYIGTNEIIDIPSSTLFSRCPANSSCVLLIGVIGNAPPSNVANSSCFELTMMDQSRRLTSDMVLTTTIFNKNSYDYWWLMIDTRVKNQLARWNYFITVGTQDLQSQVDLYVSLFSGSQMPTLQKSDFFGNQFGPDFVNITSDNLALQSETKGFHAIFIVGVYSTTNTSTYTLMNWGPTEYGQGAFNVSEISLTQEFNPYFNYGMQFSPNSSVPQYKIFRYFSYGTRDLTFTIAPVNTSVYVLANSQPVRSQTVQPITFEAAQSGILVPSYSGLIPGTNSSLRLPQLNSLLNVPLFNSTSLITPLIIKTNQSATITVSKDSTQNGLWCQFCWYYIAIFQAALPANQSAPNSSVGVSVFQPYDAYDNSLSNIHLMRPGLPHVNLNLGGANSSFSQTAQYKFVLENFNPLVLNITSKQVVSVYLTAYADYANNPKVWNSSGGPGSQVLRVRFPDERFQIGVYYYVTVVGKSNVTIALWQETLRQGLRNGTYIIDRMQNRDDLVKYYYVISPDPGLNYTGTITIIAATLGFQPLIYAYANLVANGTFNASNLVYPSPANFTQKFERPFFMGDDNQTTAFSFNISTMSSSGNFTSWTASGAYVPPTSQTYYTFTVYWSNYGLTPLTDTEFIISLSISPLPASLALSQATPDLPLREVTQ